MQKLSINNICKDLGDYSQWVYSQYKQHYNFLFHFKIKFSFLQVNTEICDDDDDDDVSV